MKKWKQISSKLAFDNPWFQVRQDTVELPNGKIVDDYFVWLEGRVVLVVPVTEHNEFILVKQYKHAYQDIVIEFPAGYVNEDESTVDAAQRELREETGYTSTDCTLMTQLTNHPTKVVGSLYVYLAKGAVKSSATAFDENEEIEVLVKPYREVIDMITSGKIVVTGTISAALLACKKLHLEI